MRQRIILILFGISLFFVLLEAGLRISGFILLSLQEHRNKLAIREKGTYRILCLGESTTARQWPPALQEVLRQHNTGIEFSVIDKGKAAVKTAFILNQLESYLDEYHPDMVVAMMGVNDDGKHLPYERPTLSKTKLFIRSLRTYKLARLLWLHMRTKATVQKRQSNLLDMDLGQPYLQREDNIKKETVLKKALASNPRDDGVYVELSRLYREEGKYQQAEECVQKALQLNPKNDWAYFSLGLLRYDQVEYQQAEGYFKKVLELNPTNDWACLGLAWIYGNQENYQQAEEYLQKAFRLNSNSEGAILYRIYRDQGEYQQAEEYLQKVIQLNTNFEYAIFYKIYRNQESYQQAEEYLQKAIRLNPGSYAPYFAFGRLRYDQGEYQQAEGYFKKALELHPTNTWIIFYLGSLCQKQGNYQQAEEYLGKALELNTGDEAKLYGALGVIYEETGKFALAQERYSKAEQITLSGYNPQVTHNYQRLKEILDARRIKLVCVQYPMRNVEQLKKIFQNNSDGILFVDNQRSFREAVKKEGYKAYFIDMFAGNFGHCTDKGNRLLAENIARVILREVGGR